MVRIRRCNSPFSARVGTVPSKVTRPSYSEVFTFVSREESPGSASNTMVLSLLGCHRVFYPTQTGTDMKIEPELGGPQAGVALNDAFGNRMPGQAGNVVNAKLIHHLLPVFLHRLDADA